MKYPTLPYRIFTGLAAALMVLSSIPDVRLSPEAVAIFGHLGYPRYLLPFLGTAKLLGVITMLVPGFHRVKEWAYSGLIIDVTGALYSHVSVGDPPSAWAPASIALLLLAASYFFYRQTIGGHSVPETYPGAPTGRIVERLS